MISPKVRISSSLYRPAINRSVACHSARLRLSAVPREIASSRSLRNDFASLILTDLKSQQSAGKRYSLRSVITSKGNFLVKEGGQVPPLKNSLKCLLFCLLLVMLIFFTESCPNEKLAPNCCSLGAAAVRAG